MFRLIDFNSAFRPGVDDLLDWNPTFKKGYSAHELAAFDATKPLDLCPATDLYSVAAIFFKLLIGRPPQADDGDSMDEWPQWISKSKCLTGASNRLVKETADFLLRGLSSWSKSRFESVAKMQEAIEHLKGLNEGYRLKNRPKYPNKYFVCRGSELEGIHESLKKENYVILEGMGGIGKTELAKKYTQMYKDDYDFVQLVTFNGNLESTIATSLLFHNFDNEWYTKTHKDLAVSKMYAEKIDHLKKYGERTLIIMDNYDPPELDDGKIFDEFVSAEYRIIFTSRNALRGKARLKIGAMHDKINLFKLFYSYYDSPKLTTEDEATVNDIIDLVLGHTMTVMLIASAMRQGMKTPKEMLERLQNSLDPGLRTQIAVDKEGLSDKDRKQVMYGHIKTLFDMEKIKPDVNYSYIMTNMALVPYEGLKKEDFYEYALKGHYESQGHIDAYYDDLDYLIDRYWVQSSDGKVSLHPVISDVVYKDEDLSPDSQKCVALIESLIKLTKDHESETHVAWANSMNMLKLACERITDETVVVAKLLNSFASVANSLANYDIAAEYYLKAAGIIEEELGKEHPYTATVYIQSALAHFEHGDYSKALEFYQKAITVYEEVLGREHLCTATAYNNIAGVYLKQRDYPKALESHHNALVIREKVLGKGHLDTAIIYNNIGGIYSSQGDYHKALEFYQRALIVFEKVLGEEHFDTATIYSNIASGYSNLSDYPKAMELYCKALTVKEKVLGKEHPRTAATYSGIASTHYDQGNYCEALEFYQRALIVFEKVLGEEHFDTATIYSNIANVYLKQTDYSKALEFEQKALTVFEKKLGKEHSDTITIYTHIAGIYLKQTDYSKALELNHKILAIREKVLGKEHLDTVTTYNDIANIHYKQSDYLKAWELYHKALVIKGKILGKEHPDVAVAYNNIAGVCFKQGNYLEAMALWQRALSICERALGKEHLAIPIYNNIARVCFDLGDYPKAMDLYHMALAACEKVLDKEHLDIATAYSGIALIYFKQGDFPKALKWYNKALVTFELILDYKHLDAATAYNNIASIYSSQGDYPEALELYHKALLIREEMLGEEHLDTATIYNNIARVHFDLGDFPKTLELYQKSLVAYEKVLGKDHSSVIELYGVIAWLREKVVAISP